MSNPVLKIKNLSVDFRQDGRTTRAVQDISFDLMPGETVCVVGESGSGKSVTALATMGLLVPSAQVAGEIWFANPDRAEPPVNLLLLSPDQRRQYRGGRFR